MASIQSMTGYASAVAETSSNTCTLDLKSINGRFLELNFKLPDNLRHLEPIFRKSLQSRLNRGKVELLITQTASGTGGLNINHELLGKLTAAVQEIGTRVDHTTTDTVALLAWPGVIAGDPDAAARDDEIILRTFENAVTALVLARTSEGQRLRDSLLELLKSLEHGLNEVGAMLSDLISRERTRLTERLSDLKVECEPERLEQEVVLLAQKSDVREEYDRLRAHIQAVRDILSSGGLCGKRLDFMMQELNREANTMASKSSNLGLTRLAVEFKVLIEQMREQVQNLE